MDKFASSSNEQKEQIPEQKKRQNNTTLNKVTSFCLVFLGVIPDFGSNIGVEMNNIFETNKNYENPTSKVNSLRGVI